jgi:hypothetical protein
MSVDSSEPGEPPHSDSSAVGGIDSDDDDGEELAYAKGMTVDVGKLARSKACHH